MAIVARYTGPKNDEGMPAEYHAGIPARNLDEDDFANLTDEQKATLAGSAIYSLQKDAPAEAAKAEKRVDRAESAEAPKPS